MTSNQGKRLSTSSAASQLIGVVESINKNASDYRDSDSDNDLPIKSMAVDSGRNSDGGTDDDNSYINNPLFAVPSSAPRTLRGGRKNGGTSTTISYPARPLPAERPRTPLQKTPSVMSFGRDPRTAPPRSVLLTRRDLQLRYLVLAIGCLLYAGSFYSYDIPSALHEQLRERMTASNNFETYFNLLYTVYSVPNVLLPLLGGYFVDRVGPVYCIYMFSLLLLVGQSTFSLGTYLRSWAFMICGRTIYGLGAESLAVGISSLVATWFDKPELAMAFAMTLSVGHVASILVDVLSPRVASAQGTVWAVVVGMVPNLMNVILSLVLFYVEEAGERKCRGNEESLRDLTTSLMSDVGGDSNGVTFNFPTDDDDDDSDVLDDEQDAEDDNYSKRSWVSDMRTFGPVLWLICIQGFLLYGIAFPFNNIASGLLLERNYLRDPDPGCTLRYPDQCTSGTEVSDSSPNPSVDASGALCPPSFAESGIAPVLPSSLNFTYTSEDWLFPSYVYDDLKRSDVDCDDPFFSEACAKDFCDAQAAATKKNRTYHVYPLSNKCRFDANLWDCHRSNWMPWSLVPRIVLAFHLCTPHSGLSRYGSGGACNTPHHSPHWTGHCLCDGRLGSLGVYTTFCWAQADWDGLWDCSVIYEHCIGHCSIDCCKNLQCQR
uniref:Lysosomal dipeptide transporter MFSD1 n=1 Tax=Corethron hystrix TaxID=216773 RepID=A0A7S1BCL9_9STRA|mmetsp:Transcript_21627/g.49192  ORF Transcript_21627/g.49192 Transcript_21627/m.49192 type:complete len:658 (+) Transcript_21627:27-2000(+)